LDSVAEKAIILLVIVPRLLHRPIDKWEKKFKMFLPFLEKGLYNTVIIDSLGETH